jgi:hypothetical protein
MNSVTFMTAMSGLGIILTVLHVKSVNGSMLSTLLSETNQGEFGNRSRHRPLESGDDDDCARFGRLWLCISETPRAMNGYK